MNLIFPLSTIDGTSQSRTHSDSDQLEVIAGDNLTYDPRGNQLTDNRGNDHEMGTDKLSKKMRWGQTNYQKVLGMGINEMGTDKLSK